MATPEEPDFPVGHPGRQDYDPASAAAQAWHRAHIWTPGERDFRLGHPKASDTPGNRNTVEVLPGVDPDHPELEAFTGRTPEQAAAARRVYQDEALGAKPSPAVQPTIAPEPPAPGAPKAQPSGQPGATAGLMDKARSLFGH